MPDSDTRLVPSFPGDADSSFSHWFESHRNLLLSIALLAAVFWTLVFFSFTADDAFISFRYSKNLVLHHVWNWNASGPREEADTSAIYAALAIIPTFLHLPTVIFMKLIGLACLGILVYRLRTLASSRFAFLLGLIVIAVSPVVWVHTYSDLETPLYMLLIVEMAIAVKRAPDTSPAWVYALFLLLPLTRPEGFVFACAGVILFWNAPNLASNARGPASNVPNHSPKHLAWFALTLLLGLAYFLARWRYFHHLLPNPFYVKVAHEPLRDLLGELLTNLAQFKGYFFALALIALLAKKSLTRVFALCALALLLLLFAPHEMAMNYADRFYVQLTLPVLLIFLITEDVPRLSRFAALIAALFVLAISPTELLRQIKYPSNIARAHFDIGKRLAPFAANHTLIAGDVGGIPFYSNWFSYDFLGLATNTIAQHGLTVADLQQIHPDLIILYNANPGPALLHDGSWVGGPLRTGRALVDYINQSGEYQYAGSAKSNGFYLVEFLRKDTPQHDQILSTLQQNTVTSTTRLSLGQLFLQKYLPSSN
jgi:arabinofuranosyltransferase